MNKKTLLVFTSIFIFLLFLNCLTPMAFGDDYLYAFIWEGHSMFKPLSTDAVRIASVNDLIISQRSLYLTWGGRVVGQSLTQIFIWLGKDIFNFLNAFVGTILILEIYWIVNKGNINLKVQPKIVCWIFFALWSFAPGFSDVFFWLTCSCIYLWPSVLLFGFIIPYIKKFYRVNETIGKRKYCSAVVMFFVGILAGCGNENNVCWFILALFIFLFLYKKKRMTGKSELWLYTGVIGLIIGYLILMLSPGNMSRLLGEHGSNWFGVKLLQHHFLILIVVLLFQAFLWYFGLKSFYILKKRIIDIDMIRKDLLLVGVLMIISLSMSLTMLFSPEFPIRSGFHGAVPLIIATGILLRIQQEQNLELISKDVRATLIGFGIICFFVTATVSCYNFYEKKIYMNEILASVKQAQEMHETEILRVKPFRTVSFSENLLSGLHIPNYNLTEEENSWGNVSFARYYKIPGIKVVK